MIATKEKAKGKAWKAGNSYKCTTRLIVTGTRHCYAAWVWSCTNLVRSARNMPREEGQMSSASVISSSRAPQSPPPHQNKDVTIPSLPATEGLFSCIHSISNNGDEV